MANSSLVKVRGRFNPALIDWVSNSESEITEEVEQAIDRVLEDRRKRTQVFLTAVAKEHVRRIVYLFEQFPQIEAELFTERRLTSMKNSDLIRLLGIVGDQVKDATDVLQMFVSSDDLKAEPLLSRRGQPELPDVTEEEPTDEELEALSQLPATSRKKVFKIFERVIRVAEEVERSIEVDTVPEVPHDK